MAIHRAATWPWAHRHTNGTLHYKNLYSNSFGYTETQNEVNGASDTAVMAAVATTVGEEKNITSGLTDPDVPRALKVVPGGTTTDIQESVVTVYGTNVEGKVISEAFRFAADANSATEGNKAFRTVTSVNFDAQLSTAVTFSIGYTNKLGVNHRLYTNNTTVKVYTFTTPYSTLTLQGVPTVVASDIVERNLVTPATVPDNTFSLVIAYAFDNWSDGTTLNDQPEYSTTTSTSSTSSSTSTTTVTTSTSSTSISTSSTSISTSSTSISTSSTSTSTTTLP